MNVKAVVAAKVAAKVAAGILFSSQAFMVPSAFAQQGQLLIDASPCLVFETSVERLVCFEEQVKAAENARQGTATSSAASNLPVLTIQRSNAGAAPAPQAPARTPTAPAVPQPAPAEQAAAPQAQDSQEDFGRQQQRREVIDQPRVELTSKIASVRQLQRGLWQVTLENGQVWRQMNSKNYPLVAGQTVRIYPSGWGKSFRLTVKELGSFIQVERIE